MDRNHGVRGILKRPTSWKSVGQEELVPQRPLQASLRQSAVLVAVPVRIQPGGKVEGGLLALAAGVRVGAAGRVCASPYESLERGAAVCVRPTRSESVVPSALPCHSVPKPTSHPPVSVSQACRRQEIGQASFPTVAFRAPYPG